MQYYVFIVICIFCFSCKQIPKLQRIGMNSPLKERETSFDSIKFFQKAYDSGGVFISCDSFLSKLRYYTNYLQIHEKDTLSISEYICLQRLENTISLYELTDTKNPIYTDFLIAHFQHCRKVSTFRLLEYEFLGSICYSPKYDLQSGIAGSGIGKNSIFDVCHCFFQECLK